MSLIVDLETTDLLNQSSSDPELQPGIVQIGLVEVDDNTLMATNSESIFVNPERPMSTAALATHKIGPERYSDEPTMASILGMIAPIFRRHSRWVGYNLHFDRTVLGFQVLRYGWLNKFPWPSYELDIMKVATDVLNLQGKQSQKPPTLTALYEHLMKRPLPDAHDAMADCYATLTCWQELCKMEVL